MAPHLRLSVLLIPVAGLFAATACAEAPAAEDLALHDHEASSSIGSWAPHGVDPEAASIAGRSIPTQPEPGDDAQPSEVDEAEPTAPRIIVTDYDEQDEPWPDASGTALCPFEVHTPGFPAVTQDGTTVVYAIIETLSASEGDDELVTVRWLDVESDSTDEAIVVVDGEEFKTDDHCRRLWRHAKVVAAEINERLDAQPWRVLEPLPVATGSGWWEEPTPEQWRAEQLALPARQRHVELVYQHQEAIVRIPGVAVLGRRHADWRSADESEWCGFTPLARAVYGDRETGVAVAEVVQESGSCMCDSETLVHALDLQPEAFAEIDERNGDLVGC